MNVLDKKVDQLFNIWRYFSTLTDLYSLFIIFKVLTGLDILLEEFIIFFFFVRRQLYILIHGLDQWERVIYYKCRRFYGMD